MQWNREQIYKKEMKKKYKIGFLGLGTVGGGVYKHMTEKYATYTSRFAADYELSKICVRDLSKARAIDIDSALFTQEPLDIVNDPEIDIVCELMGGVDLAYDLTMKALANGKVVISANKAVICEYGKEILAQAKKYNTAYFFESSVAGGIPVIKALREGLVANNCSSIYGILNGTCNYILTRMERENASYQSILVDARRLGYVEADESLDLDGWDSAHKISILSYLANGSWISTDDMLVKGIRRILLEDMLWAKEFDYRVKLVASAKRYENGSIFASVYPALLPLSDSLANVNEAFNAVSITGDVVGRTVYIGRGAGQDATASAVIADIADALAFLEGSKIINTIESPELKIASLDEVEGAFYMRVEVQDKVGVLASLTSALAKENVSVEKFQQHKHEECFLICLFGIS